MGTLVRNSRTGRLVIKAMKGARCGGKDTIIEAAKFALGGVFIPPPYRSKGSPSVALEDMFGNGARVEVSMQIRMDRDDKFWVLERVLMTPSRTSPVKEPLNHRAKFSLLLYETLSIDERDTVLLQIPENADAPFIEAHLTDGDRPDGTLMVRWDLDGEGNIYPIDETRTFTDPLSNG